MYIILYMPLNTTNSWPLPWTSTPTPNTTAATTIIIISINPPTLQPKPLQGISKMYLDMRLISMIWAYSHWIPLVALFLMAFINLPKPCQNCLDLIHPQTAWTPKPHATHSGTQPKNKENTASNTRVSWKQKQFISLFGMLPSVVPSAMFWLSAVVFGTKLQGIQRMAEL